MDPWQIVAVLATALGTTWAAFIAAFFKGDLIPGVVYRREVDRADTATTQAERNAKALETLTLSGKTDSRLLKEALAEIVKLKARPHA